MPPDPPNSQICSVFLALVAAGPRQCERLEPPVQYRIIVLGIKQRLYQVFDFTQEKVSSDEQVHRHTMRWCGVGHTTQKYTNIQFCFWNQGKLWGQISQVNKLQPVMLQGVSPAFDSKMMTTKVFDSKLPPPVFGFRCSFLGVGRKFANCVDSWKCVYIAYTWRIKCN